jgi:hypothetical protein
MSTPCLRTGRRGAVIAVIVAIELASAGFAIGVAAAAPGLRIVVTVSVDGAISTWAAAVPTTPAAPGTTSTSTAPVDESSRPSEPQPATRS